MDRPTNAEVSGLLRALRQSPELRGFVASVRVALRTGLPAMAYHSKTNARLSVRRGTAGEAPLVAVMDDRVVATSRGAAAPSERMINVSVRMPAAMRAELDQTGAFGSSLRTAVREWLDRQHDTR